MRALSLLLAAAALAGCAAPPQAPRCAAGTKPMLVAELFFGRNLAGAKPVTDAAWAKFADDTLSRQLPGFTAVDAEGQWREPDTRRLDAESTKFVIVALGDDPAAPAAIHAVIAEFLRRFDQRSVGLLMDRRCGDFGG